MPIIILRGRNRFTGFCGRIAFLIFLGEIEFYQADYHLHDKICWYFQPNQPDAGKVIVNAYQFYTQKVVEAVEEI